MTDPLARFLRPLATRMFGKMPESARILWHHRAAALTEFVHEAAVARWKALDPQLATLALIASAGEIGCSWCIDFGYYAAHVKGQDLDKVSEVPRWRESMAFTDLEREVLGYAEAMTATPPTVTDEMVAALDRQLGHAALVELSLLIAVENQRSRFNSAMGLTSQGYSDVCALPLAPRTP